MKKKLILAMVFVLPSSLASFGTVESVSAAIEPGKTAQINNGDYTGGVDIPVGNYILDCKTTDSEFGIVWLSSETDNLEEDYPSLIYENVSRNENRKFYISLHDGGILHVPFKAELTSVDLINGECEELYTGTYTAGEDLGEAKYLVSYDTGDTEHGIIWLADADDNLEEDYPSMLYEHIAFNEKGTYFVSLEAGRKMYLPVDFNSVVKMEEIEFENDHAVLYAGQYVIGDDIPAGTYDITCMPDEWQTGGIIWVSAPGDNLDEEYPSVLYEFINSEETFHVKLEEGGRLMLPVKCEVQMMEGGIAFK